MYFKNLFRLTYLFREFRSPVTQNVSHLQLPRSTPRPRSSVFSKMSYNAPVLRPPQEEGGGPSTGKKALSVHFFLLLLHSIIIIDSVHESLYHLPMRASPLGQLLEVKFGVPYTRNECRNCWHSSRVTVSVTDWADRRTPHAASAVPIEMPETLRVRCCRSYVFGYKCEIGVIQGGVPDGSWLAVYTKLSILCSSLCSINIKCPSSCSVRVSLRV